MFGTPETIFICLQKKMQVNILVKIIVTLFMSYYSQRNRPLPQYSSFKLITAGERTNKCAPDILEVVVHLGVFKEVCCNFNLSIIC